MIPSRYLPRPLPDALKGLDDLAMDLRWSWNHGADRLWQTVDPLLWEGTGDPWLILESTPYARFEALAHDPEFLERLREQLVRRAEYLQKPSWFSTTHTEAEPGTAAYFSMEFGLSEALPIYSGGLGILAGDHLKAASDLGVPLVAIGLLYQQGYFRQVLSADGEQLEFYPYNNPAMLPVLPFRTGGGEWLRIPVELPGRAVQLRVWQVQVGRVPLYLLDSNDLLNAPGDRSITAELYGGGPEMRLQQEIVLGIGGWGLLQTLGIDCTVCHLNEGHAAFAVLERARSFMALSGRPFQVALRCTRVGNIFTTHTPVAAGFDRFAPALMEQYFADYVQTLGISLDELLALGRSARAGTDEPFNMAYLALHGCGAANGVSRLHGVVSRRIFQPLFERWPEHEVPVGHITNGAHMPSWDSAPADRLWTQACGKARWLGGLETVEAEFRRVDDPTLWALRGQGRRALIESVRKRLARQYAMRGADPASIAECARMLDPDTLTLGFARRFTGYKRPDLLLHDSARLARLLADRERPVQLVIAGKAHPQDAEGKRLVRKWVRFMQRPDLCGRAVFLEDYDIALATELVQGVDVWINTPRRPWEASGTSGMKVLVNGGLNLSELDGWWAEAYAPEVGWALGDRREHDHDPAWDAAEAEALYELLEREVVPLFYSRDARGIPAGWVARMRESMARLTPAFSTNRMVREYTGRLYLPAAAAWRQRSIDDGRLGAELESWHSALTRHWSKLRFGRLEVRPVGQEYFFQVQVYLDDLDPGAVRVELYAEPFADAPAVRATMLRGELLPGAVHGYLYEARVPASRPMEHYTPRIIPAHPEARVPLEANLILWQR